MKVGFVGLGRMGQAMAARLLGGGHDLVVYNRSRDKAAELEKGGAKVAGSVAEACKGREVVISMVSDDKALTEVVKEISGALDKGAIHVAMGTHGVHVLREVDAVHGKARPEVRRLARAGPARGCRRRADRHCAGGPCRRHREGRAVECADGPAHVPGRRRSQKAPPP